MEFEELFRILRATVTRHRRLILQLCLWSTLSALVLSFLIPESYEATALVLIRPQENIELAPQTTDKELLNLPAGSTLQSDTPSKTYIEVIKSRAVAESIVTRLGLDRAGIPDEPRLADRLKAMLKAVVSAVRDLARYGRIVEISDFERAIRKLQKNLKLTDLRDTFVFRISYESGDPQQAAAVANTAAEVFVESSTEQSEREAREQREFIGAQLAETQTGLERTRGDLRAFKEANRSVSFEEEKKERVRSLVELEASLEEADAKLQGLLGRYTPANPAVRAARARHAALTDSVQRQRKSLQAMPEQEAELARLELEVTGLESNLQLLQKHYERARLRESSPSAEIRVVSPAPVPVYPSAPIKMYYALAGFALSLFAGFGIALGLEITDSRLHSVDDVEEALGLPVIASTPRVEFR